MSKRQRYYTPTLEDSWFDTFLDALKKHYGIEDHSDLITRIVIEHTKVIEKSQKVK